MADRESNERLGAAVHSWLERHQLRSADLDEAQGMTELHGDLETSDLFRAIAVVLRAEEDPDHAGRAFLAGVEGLSDETRERLMEAHSMHEEDVDG